MALATGFVTAEEMWDHLELIAASQNGPIEQRLASGAVIPPFAIPDHVLFDRRPVYYPGTYSSGEDQGGEPWGIMPPTNNHYDFILIAWHLWRTTGSTDFLVRNIAGLTIIEHLQRAFDVPRTDPKSGLVVTDAATRAVGFIYCDSIYMTGHLLFASLLRWRAAQQLAELEDAMGLNASASFVRAQVATIPSNLAETFGAPRRIGGWLMAATDTGRQPDVWGTIYALYLGLLDGESARAALGEIVRALEEGTISLQGAIRHVPVNHDASPTSAWERTLTPHNRYQNGAYWHVPTGWLIAVLAKEHPAVAQRLFNEMITHFQAEDFRKGPEFCAPWECLGQVKDAYANPVFLGSVVVPFGVLKTLDGLA